MTRQIEVFYIAREAMNRFDFYSILGVDYGGEGGPSVDEYEAEAWALLEFLERRTLGKPLTKSELLREIKKIYIKYFDDLIDSDRCRLITEHIYNEIAKQDLYPTSVRSRGYHLYYRQRNICRWPELNSIKEARRKELWPKFEKRDARQRY